MIILGSHDKHPTSLTTGMDSKDGDINWLQAECSTCVTQEPLRGFNNNYNYQLGLELVHAVYFKG